MEHEQTRELRDQTQADLARTVKSRLKRETARCRIQQKMYADPPTIAELHRVVAYVDPETALPSNWHTAAPLHEARQTRAMHEATVFITSNPWQPSTELITWAAVLVGGWVLLPAVFMNRVGASIKFKKALGVQRTVWVSENARRENPRLWLLLLEIMNLVDHKWTILLDVHAYCAARVKAETAKRSAMVLSLVTDAESVANPLPHIFKPSDFLDFIRDVERSTAGLPNM